MTDPIAVIGLACRYPDAAGPSALWESVLAQRRAFRRVPSARVPLDEYGGARDEPDVTYGRQAAVLTNWQFDREAFRVAGSTFRTVDPSHWLALECAARALEDAGFAGGDGLPRETTAVVLGNTLTGDYSRAAALRLRWPFVRRALAEALQDEGLDAALASGVLERAEARFKEPLPAVNEETLAGWLSNTIAGRICNHFDLGGGGFVVDGACSSSLLAVTTACDALRTGAADVVLAGGVDLSLDPFELVGFAKAQALAEGEMRVYDRESRGFVPGEGCGIAVLMREADARERGRRIYARVRGWGVSSDGRGGITRPEIEGQRRALRRAYAMAGFDIGTVGYFEGHGTGTAVGDAAEIAALAEERRTAGTTSAAALGSIKANIGHTKAAAGMAGFIKAVLALHTRIVPPATGCRTPHATLDDPAASLHIERAGRLWPAGASARASVSAMGFGGINAHVALEAAAGGPRPALTASERSCLRAPQDAEIFPLAADDRGVLLDNVIGLRRAAAWMSQAEMTDAAVALQLRRPAGGVRAAIVASTPEDLETACERLADALAGTGDLVSPGDGVFAGAAVSSPPRIGFLFPGQASPSHVDGGVWRRRFAALDDLYSDAAGAARDSSDTRVAQPAIVRSSLGALRLLRALGVDASVAVGHSLGELCALHWSGAIDEASLRRIVEARAAAMADFGAPGGGMAGIGAPATVVRARLTQDVVIAGFNGPGQTVISGPLESVRQAAARFEREGLAVSLLRVSHAFHSPSMQPAAQAFADALRRERLHPPDRRILSTITGRPIDRGVDLAALLIDQIASPVRFDEAIAAVIPSVDLFVEVGSGRVLTDLVTPRCRVPVLPLDAGGAAVRGLLNVIAAAFTMGVSVDWSPLIDGRFARPFDLSVPPTFLASPCEAGRVAAAPPRIRRAAGAKAEPPPAIASERGAGTPIEVACAIVARRAELPRASVDPRHRLLSDLHLNSISATQVIVDLARALEIGVPANASMYADAAIEDVVEALLAQAGAQDGTSEAPTGIAPWVRTFHIAWHDEPRPPRRRHATRPTAIHAVDGDPLAAALRTATRDGGPGGLIVCLPDSCGADHVAALLRAARDRASAGDPLVVVHRGGGGGAAARSIWLERPAGDVAAIDVDTDGEATAQAILDEAAACAGFADVRLRDGRRQVSAAAAIEWGSGPPALGHEDVLLVTGGGRGITVECALAIARRTRTALAIIGRAARERDADLDRNLQRLEAAGIRVRYVQCDVTDREAVHAAVREVERSLGPVAALLHGAAVNAPRLLADLDDAAIDAAMAAKVAGLHHVLEAVDPARLRLCVGFGSLIARTGMRGESHYAAANELMAMAIDRWAAARAGRRGLTVEWSVWAGTGMGERLQTLAALERDGIVPLTIDQGTAAFVDLLASPAHGRVIVTGRFPQGPTLRLAGGEPPVWRFLERPVAWYPGVELVAESDLSRSSDLYLDDHVVDGERVLPGVIGLEAMAQAAGALTGGPLPPVIEFQDVVFERPIVVPAEGTRTLRIAALARDGGVDLAVRSDETLHAADHFRARCRFVDAVPDDSAIEGGPESDALADAGVLYGSLLFQGGRFARVRAYRELHATRCAAVLDPAGEPRWFSAFLPPDLVIGDPGAHDAAFHAVQVCVPESRLLPVAIERVRLRRGAAIREIRAIERSRRGRAFTYDIVATDDDGRVCGEWRGARFMQVSAAVPRGGWIPELLAPAIERAAASLGGEPVVEAFVTRMTSGESGRAAVASRMGGPLVARPDGRPEIAGSGVPRVSIAHDEALVLAVTAGTTVVGCDLQACDPRPGDDWFGLLGREGWQLARFISARHDERADIAASRVWCARECLLKAGLPAASRLSERGMADGWATLAGDGVSVLTRAFPLLPDGRTVMVAILLGATEIAVRPAREVVA